MSYATNAARPLPEDVIARYVIDVKGSKFTVQAFSTGLLSAFGHSPTIAIRDYEGEASFTVVGSKLQDAELHLKIRAGSLEVTDDISDSDRTEIERQMHENVLETDRFPEIEYECAGVSASGSGDRYWLNLAGSLSLHGTTRNLPVSARVAINGDSLRASGEFQVRQSDFQISIVKVAGGTIRLKDEVKCQFDIMARKQQ